MAFRGYCCVLLAAALWGSLGPVAKYAFSQGVQPLEVAFWRCVIPFAPFAFQALRGGYSLRVEPGDRLAMGGFGLICIAAFYGVYQLAINEGGAALASVLMYTAPAWVALAAWGMLGEGMSAAKLGAVAATLAGVACVGGILGQEAGHGVNATPTAVLLGLLSGLTYAMYYIFGKGRLRRYPTPVLFLHGLPLGALLLLPFVEFSPKTPGAWVAIVTVSLLSTWGAYSVYYAGLRHLEATRAAVVATLEPVVAAVVAFFWWGERFTAAGWLGAGLILGAVGLVVWDGRRRPRAAGREATGNG
jgi:DME family drug/metabolite transporter